MHKDMAGDSKRCKHFLSNICVCLLLESGLQGAYHLAKYESIRTEHTVDAVRVGTTNENQWSSEAVRSYRTHCVCCI